MLMMDSKRERASFFPSTWSWPLKNQCRLCSLQERCGEGKVHGHLSAVSSQWLPQHHSQFILRIERHQVFCHCGLSRSKVREKQDLTVDSHRVRRPASRDAGRALVVFPLTAKAKAADNGIPPHLLD